MQVALTLLQFVALALPAIGIYLQIIGGQETGRTKVLNQYHTARGSIMLYLSSAVFLLVYIGANVQSGIGRELVGSTFEIGLLYSGVASSVLATLFFALTTVSRLFKLSEGEETIIKATMRTIRDLLE